MAGLQPTALPLWVADTDFKVAAQSPRHSVRTSIRALPLPEFGTGASGTGSGRWRITTGIGGWALGGQRFSVQLFANVSAAQLFTEALTKPRGGGCGNHPFIPGCCPR